MNLKATLSTLVAAAIVSLAMGTVPAQAAAVPINATKASDWSGDGRADVVVPTYDGTLWMYRGNGTSGFLGSRVQVGQGWNGLDQIRMVGNWDGVAGTDIIARNASTGALVLYPGNGAGGFRPSRTIGSGWQIFSHIMSPGDWDGDGHPDLLATVRSDGTLRLYRGDGRGGFLGMRVIGRGWGPMDSLLTTGDFDGDHLPDFLARNTTTGDLALYRSNGTGGFAATKIVGRGWGAFTALLGPGDWSGDGHSDVLARASDGTLRMYRGNGAGGWVNPYPVIGTGWNAIRFPDQPAPGPAPSGTVCTNPYFTTSDPNGGITDGPYYVHNNLWNASNYPGTTGTTSVCSYHSWNHVAKATDTGDGAVKTYPNVHLDTSGPTISSLRTLTSVFAARSPNVGIYDVAYDLWLNGVPNDEVMVWTDNHGQFPGGTRVASNVSLSGYTWDVYATSGNGAITFVPSGGAHLTSGSLDLKAMLMYLVNSKRTAASSTVDQICYGVEIVDTGGAPATWNFTNFSITLN